MGAVGLVRDRLVSRVAVRTAVPLRLLRYFPLNPAHGEALRPQLSHTDFLTPQAIRGGFLDVCDCLESQSSPLGKTKRNRDPKQSPPPIDTDAVFNVDMVT